MSAGLAKMAGLSPPEADLRLPCWAAVTWGADGPIVVVRCRSRREAEDEVSSGNWLAEGWKTVTVEAPSDLPPRRRLGICGESATEAALREIRDDASFGHYVFGRRPWGSYYSGKLDDRAALFDLIDHETDPFSCSINDLEETFRRAWERFSGADEVDAECACPRDCDAETCDCQVCLDDGSPGERESESPEFNEWREDDVRQMLELFKVERDRFVAQALRKRRIRSVWPEHRCAAVVSPITPWPNVGGVYFLQSRAPTDRAVKIGWSKNNIHKRISDLKTAHPWPLDLLAFIEGATLADEGALHSRFDSLRLTRKGEAHGDEWFRLEGDLVAEILRLRGAAS